VTPEELDCVKGGLKRMHEPLKELWLEKQLLRNLILDSGWMPEGKLDLAIVQGKIHPENIRQVEQQFAADEQRLAEIGLGDWLTEFDKHFPRSD
jgi:hypothetical protein